MRLGSFLLCWVVVASACGLSHEVSRDGGARDATVADAGRCGPSDCADADSRTDGGGGPARCGGEVCASGELCCPLCGSALFCSPGPTCPVIDCPIGCERGVVVCAHDEYCDYPGNTCGGEGECRPRPNDCTGDCVGVCGCDGNDYCNACTAAAAGVDIAYEGHCVGRPDCSVMDARSQGACDALVGYAWNGSQCVAIQCSCAGADCARLYPDRDGCVLAHADCIGSLCGGIVGAECSGDEFCDYPDEALCGAADGAGVCRSRPMGCSGMFAPVCGCDGRTYDNACKANAAGTDVAHAGACG